MPSTHESDVVVAGAGPVGLFAALTLRNRGHRVSVFDAEWRETARSYALALHPGTLDELDAEGVAADILHQGRRIESIAFYEGAERRLSLPLGGLTGTAFPFVLSLPQSNLERLLIEALNNRGVTVRWNHRVAAVDPAADHGDHAVAQVHRLDKVSSGYAVASTDWVVDAVLPERCAYVVGADGHASAVRRGAGIEWSTQGPSALYAVFEFAGDGPSGDEVRIVLGEHTTDVLWPLPDRRWRWSFEIPDVRMEAWREKSRLAVQVGTQVYHHLSAELFHDLIRERAPWFPPQSQDVLWSVVVRFERRLASSFGRDRTWLAGDSGHLAGPVGALSMNVGLREARDLADRLSRVLRGESGPYVLADYARERDAEWRSLLGTAPALQSTASPFAQRWGARMWDCLPVSGPLRAQLADHIGFA